MSAQTCPAVDISQPVGASVGIFVDRVGSSEGRNEGALLGLVVGFTVGVTLGTTVGAADTGKLGARVGTGPVQVGAPQILDWNRL